MKPRFFRDGAAFERWLEVNHERERELVVGFWKKGTGKPSIDWPTSVDCALCFGWIDGVRRSLDAESYSIRFTPRKKGSHWSAVNLRRYAALLAEGRVRPAGRAAHDRRDPERTARASHEQAVVELPADLAARLARDGAASRHFATMPPWYRKSATWWVISAKKAETRERRFELLLEHHRGGATLPVLTRPSAKGKAKPG
ncbi:MAG: YdeI/OmpD-associated family protein [Myxococcales bacterium]|nr:YdeI/OmpD-associated family protein [Myxococcales bacterium]